MPSSPRFIAGVPASVCERFCNVLASASATLVGPVSLWIRCICASAGPLSCSRRNYTAWLPAWRISAARLSCYPPFAAYQSGLPVAESQKSQVINLGLVRLVESPDFEHGKTGEPLARLTPSWERSSIVPKQRAISCTMVLSGDSLRLDLFCAGLWHESVM